jgi:hypothetical protein
MSRLTARFSPSFSIPKTARAPIGGRVYWQGPP